MASRVGGYVRRNHLGLIAIFIALGGTTWAANKVGSGDIAKNAVRSKHIKAKQVKPGDLSPKLRDRCPSGTRLFSALCVRVPTSSPTWFNTHDFCADRRLRVPSFAEANVLARNNDLPGVGDTQFFWTEEVTGGNFAVGMEGDVQDVAADRGLNGLALCVTILREGG